MQLCKEGRGGDRDVIRFDNLKMYSGCHYVCSDADSLDDDVIFSHPDITSGVPSLYA